MSRRFSLAIETNVPKAEHGSQPVSAFLVQNSADRSELVRSTSLPNLNHQSESSLDRGFSICDLNTLGRTKSSYMIQSSKLPQQGQRHLAPEQDDSTDVFLQFQNAHLYQHPEFQDSSMKRSKLNSGGSKNHNRRGSCAIKFQCPRYIEEFSGNASSH